MKKAMNYFYIFSKRQLKKISFWAILLLFPVFTIIFTRFTRSEETRIQVAVYSESETGFSAGIVDKLAKRQGIIHFYIPSGREAVFTDVSTQKAECGYIFPDNLQEQLDNNKRNKQVDLIVSPATTMDKMINEVVYSEMFEEYSLHLLEQYIIGESKLAEKAMTETDEQILLENIDSLYRLHMMDNSTFSFAYTNDIDDYQNTTADILLSPIRGLMAVLVFLAGFCGGIHYYTDMENHAYDNRNKASKRWMSILSVSISTVISGIPALLCIYLSGIATSFYREIAGLLLLEMMVICFCSALSNLIKKKVYFCSAILVFIIGSLLFTPVFLDITLFAPVFKPIEKLFLPYYYLNLF